MPLVLTIVRWGGGFFCFWRDWAREMAAWMRLGWGAGVFSPSQLSWSWYICFSSLMMVFQVFIWGMFYSLCLGMVCFGIL